MIVFTLINIDVALFKPWTGGPYHGCVFQRFIKNGKGVIINKVGKRAFTRGKKAKKCEEQVAPQTKPQNFLRLFTIQTSVEFCDFSLVFNQSLSNLGT